MTERIHTEDVEPVDCEETESNQASLSIWVFVACIVIFAALLCPLIYLRIKERYFLSLGVQLLEFVLGSTLAIFSQIHLQPKQDRLHCIKLYFRQNLTFYLGDIDRS